MTGWNISFLKVSWRSAMWVGGAVMLLMVASNAHAAIIQNGGFNRPNAVQKLPAHWKALHPNLAKVIRKNSNSFVRISGVKASSGKNKSTYLIQRGLRLKPGSRYTLYYRVKGQGNSKYHVYVEWTSQVDHKKKSQKFHSFSNGWDKPTETWEEEKFTFKYTGGNPAYVVLRVKPGSAVDFDDIKCILAPPEKGLWNHGFEKSRMAKWKLGPGATIVNDQAKFGQRALRLVSDKAGQNTSASQHHIPVMPGQRYKLTLWAKGTGHYKKKSVYQYFRITASWPGAKGAKPTSTGWIDAWGGSYQRKTFIFTVPKSFTGPAEMTLTCQVRGPGGILIDDFLLKPIAKKEQNLKIILRTPAFRNSILSSLHHPEVTGQVRSLPRGTQRLVLTCQSKNHTLQLKKTFTPEGQSVAFKFSTADWPYANYTIKARALDSKGDMLAKTNLKLRKLKPAPVEVGYGADGVLKINGKPFFPIIVYNLRHVTNALTYYKLNKMGVNCAVVHVSTPKQALQILKLAKRYHIKIIFRLPNKMPTNPAVYQNWLNTWKQLLQPKVLASPALLGYFTNDEALWQGKPLKQVKGVYKTVSQLDPYRPAWNNAAPRNTIAQLSAYSAASDIYGCDIYPVPKGGTHSALKDKTITSVGKYTDIMRKAVKDRKPIWMVLQGFAWGDMFYRHTTPVYPTWRQLRFMAYDTLVHGGDGISYWGMQSIKNPDFYHVLFRITTQLHKMSRVLVQPTVANSALRVNSSAIRILHKQFNGKNILIAINQSPRPVTATFHSDMTTDQLHVWFESRQLPCNRGSWTDRFAPYDVHIYAQQANPPAPLIGPAKPPEGAKSLMSYPTYKIFNLGPRYKGQASWIWHPGKHKPGKTWFYRKWIAPAKLKSAHLRITSDGRYTVYVNGQLIARDIHDWQTAESYAVTRKLKPGQSNTISVYIEDRAPKNVGLLVDLSYTTGDGSAQHILSNSRWKTTTTRSAGWPDIVDTSDGWKDAKIIAPYGSGPWGHAVMVIQAGHSQQD